MIDLQKKYGYLSDEAWRDLLISSSSGGARSFQLPDFPSAEIQANFVGSSYADALNEAFNFYKYFKSVCADHGSKFTPSSRFLDFGCGWGRFLRFFGKDFSPVNIFGADIDPDILKVCQDMNVPGNLQRIEPTGNLSLADGSIDIAIAYSVFTHLPATIHLHWMNEMARVLKQGAMFALTLEPRRFLDFVADVAPNGSSGWHQGLARFADAIPAHRKTFDEGGFIYIPTGGGAHRPSEIYGDAVVPRAFIDANWGQHFEIIEYLDDPSRFWQAVLLVRRR